MSQTERPPSDGLFGASPKPGQPSVSPCSICGGVGDVLGLPFDGEQRWMKCPECVDRERSAEVRVLRRSTDLLIEKTVARALPEIQEDIRKDLTGDAARALSEAGREEIRRLSGS